MNFKNISVLSHLDNSKVAILALPFFFSFYHIYAFTTFQDNSEKSPKVTLLLHYNPYTNTYQK